MGGLSQKRARAHRVGGLVKNVVIFSVRTFCMPLMNIIANVVRHEKLKLNT